MTAAFAYVFPGQGSQSTGMLAELATAYPVIAKTFTEASAVLGFDLWYLVQQGTSEELNRTENTQPALLAAGVAVYRILQTEIKAAPRALAGHSLGEYTALVCGGAIAFSDAVSLVAKRGRYMQEAVAAGEGSMAAILGLDDEKVSEICEQHSGDNVVSAANFNSPGQVVIAGHAGAVEKVVDAAREAGAKRSVILPVSVPSHCELMKPAADKLAGDLKNTEIKLPSIPVIHNVDAETKTDPDSIRSALVEQLYRPVQWTTCVRALAGKGMVKLVECGPGKVLSGLNKRIDRSLECLATSGPADLEKTLSSLRGELA